MNHIEVIDSVVKDMLQLPQVDCPVVHRFGPGIYFREVTLPKGGFIIGHHHKSAHTNVLLKGKLRLLMEDGSIKDLEAPFQYVGQPGRKVAYIFEEVVWQNIYATDETDIEKLEDMFLDKDLSWTEHRNIQQNIEQAHQQLCNDDFDKMLVDIGYTAEQVRIISENEADQIPFPFGSYKVMVTKSPIEGKGLFATAPIESGEIIAPSRIGEKRTPAGRYTNHSANPNARMQFSMNGDIDLVAIRHITGCSGGSPGEEITVDYRHLINELRRM